MPFKLANKLSNNNLSTTNESVISNAISPSQTAYAIQQLLPLKLRESGKSPTCPVQGNSNEISLSNQQGPSHSRTGSSPAMMQNAQV